MYHATHLSSYDCTIRGHDIPLDTILLVKAWTIQRDPKLWDDVTSFKPETFKMDEDDPHKLMPFGLRRRAYPRADLVLHTVNLTLVLLIRCFEWGRVTNKKVDMVEGNEITMPKVLPLEAKCKSLPIFYKVLFESMHGICKMSLNF